MTGAPGLTLGALYRGGGVCEFRVWAPRAQSVEVHFVEPRERVVPLAARDRGYHESLVEGVEEGALYWLRLDGGRERPDPASRLQPRGVHGPSAVVAPGPAPEGGWLGLPLDAYVFYELHVGTFTEAGTLDAAIHHLDDLRELGVTAVELMPIAQFPNERNWGYDGVYPWAVQSSYGGPAALRRFVAACHARHLAVVLDVVMNHLGPEGNYLAEFGPYFTDRYRTPWGQAVNFDGPGSDEVRRYFLEHALRWVGEFGVDALRVDAVHAIHDRSAHPFLEELCQAVRALAAGAGRSAHVIAESDLNDPRVVQPPEAGGLGFDAHWADDLHHALHVALTGERAGYYQDFSGPYDLARALGEGYVAAGRYSPSRQRRHGRAAFRTCTPRQFVVCAQNHDQVGNRARGERLTTLVPLEAQKLAAAAVILSPFLPLLFMGEEYGETAPFPYFTSFDDADLVEAVRRGRREEFASFMARGEEPPDPQDPATFRSAVLERSAEAPHMALRAYYRELLALRRHLAARAGGRTFEELRATADSDVVVLRRGHGVVVLLAFSMASRAVTLDLPPGRYLRRLDSADAQWGGPGNCVPAVVEATARGAVSLTPSPRSCVVLVRMEELGQ